MKLDQIRRKINAKSLSVRLDLCTLATIAEYWATQGERFRSISELVRLTVEEYANHIITNHENLNITDIDEASDILQRYALLTNRQRLEHSKNYGQALVRRDIFNRKVKGRNPSAPPSTPPSPISPSSEVTLAQQAQAEAILAQKLAKTSSTQVAEAAARTQEFKDLLAVPAKGE